MWGLNESCSAERGALRKSGERGLLIFPLVKGRGREDKLLDLFSIAPGCPPSEEREENFASSHITPTSLVSLAARSCSYPEPVSTERETHRKSTLSDALQDAFGSLTR